MMKKLSLPAAKAQYEFDKTRYRALMDNRLRAGGLKKDVPTGWLMAVHGPLVWKGTDFGLLHLYVVMKMCDVLH